MPGNTQQLLGTISNALNGLMSSVSKTQQELFDVSLNRIRFLDYDANGRLIQNANNTRELSRLKTDLDKTLRSREYTNAVKKFGNEFNVVEKLQNEWFSGIVDDFKPIGASSIAKRTAISQMVDNMVGGGANAFVTTKAGDLLLNQMQTGASIRQVNDQLRTFMLGNKNVPGRLVAYSEQIATDSINQYARSYAQQTSEDLGFEWYQYVGRVKDTTRPFCKALVKQRYIHKSELARAVMGELLYETVSTAGQIKGTNSKNIITNAGGYRCNHQFRPVSTKSIPFNHRQRFEMKKRQVRKQEDNLSKIQDKKGSKDTVIENTTESPFFGNTIAKNKELLKKEMVEAQKTGKMDFGRVPIPSYYGSSNNVYNDYTAQGSNDFKDYYSNGVLIVSKDSPPIYQYWINNKGEKTMRQLVPPRALRDLMGKYSVQNGQGVTKFQLVEGDKGGAYSPDYNTIRLNPTSNRWAISRVYPKKVLNHEYSHAISKVIGLETQRKGLVTRVNYTGKESTYETYDKFYFPNDLAKKYGDKAFAHIIKTKGGQKSLGKFDKLIGCKNTKWSTKRLKEDYDNFVEDMYAKYGREYGIERSDIREMLSVGADLMSGATRGKHGYGHGKMYWKQVSDLSKTEQQKYGYLAPEINNHNYAEFIAESGEYVFGGGNPVIDELYPGLGDVFLDFWSEVLTVYLK